MTRTGLKDVSLAYKEFFKQPDRGHPKFKKKGKAKKTVAAEITGSSFRRNGYFRLKRGMYVKMLNSGRINRYSNPVPKSARIFEEHGNWYITVTYEVDAVEYTCDSIGVGVDRNVGQVSDSTGQIYYLTDVERLEKQVQQPQRRQRKRTRGSHAYRKTAKTIAKHKRKLANIRRNDHRHIARDITTYSTLVLLEDLKVKDMYHTHFIVRRPINSKHCCFYHKVQNLYCGRFTVSVRKLPKVATDALAHELVGFLWEAMQPSA